MRLEGVDRKLGDPLRVVPLPALVDCTNPIPVPILNGSNLKRLKYLKRFKNASLVEHLSRFENTYQHHVTFEEHLSRSLALSLGGARLEGVDRKLGNPL